MLMCVFLSVTSLFLYLLFIYYFLHPRTLIGSLFSFFSALMRGIVNITSCTRALYSRSPGGALEVKAVVNNKRHFAKHNANKIVDLLQGCSISMPLAN